MISDTFRELGADHDSVSAAQQSDLKFTIFKDLHNIPRVFRLVLPNLYFLSFA